MDVNLFGKLPGAGQLFVIIISVYRGAGFPLRLTVSLLRYPREESGMWGFMVKSATYLLPRDLQNISLAI